MEYNARSIETAGNEPQFPSKLIISYARSLTEPRRIKELLQSPLHKGINYTAATTQKKKPLNLSESMFEPRHTKDMFRTPLQRKTLCAAISQEEPLTKDLVEFLPRRTKDMMQSPLHKSSTSKKCISLEPRRTKELLQSPLHNTAVSKLQLPGKPRCPAVRRKLHFNGQAMKIIMDRIVGYLKEWPAFEVIAKRGMQQMSVQEFVLITSHLLISSGQQLKPFNKTDYIERTIAAMQQLNYPYQVNKSWLKTPSASLNHIMLIFDFLLDLAPIENVTPFEFQTSCAEQAFASAAMDYHAKHALTPLQKLVSVQPAQKKTSLSELLQEEANLQTLLTERLQQLSSLRQQLAQQEQTMRMVCTELCLNNNQIKELKSCMRHVRSDADHTLDDRDMRYDELQHNQELILRRSRKQLNQNVESFNVFRRDICNSSVLADLSQNMPELPLTATMGELQEGQQQLQRLRKTLDLKTKQPAVLANYLQMSDNRKTLQVLELKKRYSM